MASRDNKFSSMASLRHAFNLIHSELFIGYHFQPTEEGIRIVNIKNGDGQLLPIFNVDDDLLQYRPEQLKECYCFTKLEPRGKNKVNRTLRDGAGHWKNISTRAVKDDNKKSIGWLTKLVLHKDKNTPTEWHLLEYRDTEWPDAGRWALCQIYKRENNNDSGSSGRFDPYLDNTTVPDPVASDIGAGQIYPSISQVSSMWSSGARGDMNQVQRYEKGQCSYTQPDCFFNAATYPHLTGDHMNQDQIHGVDQSWYTPPDGMVYSPQQITSNNTYSIGGIDMNPNQYINLDPYSDFGMDDRNGYFNPDQSSYIN